ncbi:hypothetical protein [Sphingomonas parapaucimobilis]|uniref:hypothetical protein n=1 Tax=Sphingomonas parapaucimobilis TaxID=28213 RepID=UPI00321994DA
MRIEGTDGRRLRFGTELIEGESVPGVIARSVQEHVLLRTRPVLDAAGIGMRHTGYAQLATPEELDRLAFVLRCDPAPLKASAGRPILRADTTRITAVMFGNGLVPRGALELNRRRIAPGSLTGGDFHRVDWLNRLLPYCPESLERLISVCPSCGGRLGWHYTVGLGTCEHCRRDVPPSAEPSLPVDLGDRYRLFAALSSPSPRSVAGALARLPPALRGHATGDLVKLAIRMGGLTQAVPIVLTSLGDALDLEASTLARIATDGIRLLGTWPDGVRRWAAGRMDALSTDPEGLKVLRSRLRRLTQRDGDGDDLSVIVTDALPGLRRHAVHAFSADRRYYLYKEVQPRLALEPAGMDRLRRCGGVLYEQTTVAAHRRGRFDADRIDELVPVFRNAMPFNACTGRLKLPLYAIQQCCRRGVLEAEDDPVFAAVRSSTYIRSASMDVLLGDLRAARSKTGEPGTTVSLSVASKWIGGRLKPWGSIMAALRGGELPFWLGEESPTVKTIRVLAADLMQFEEAFDDVDIMPDGPFGLVNQLDAGELLNVKPLRLPALARPLDLRFRRNGNALATPLAGVLSAASAIAWAPELSVRMGVRFRDVEALLAPLTIPRKLDGWCRESLRDRGML